MNFRLNARNLGIQFTVHALLVTTTVIESSIPSMVFHENVILLRLKLPSKHARELHVSRAVCIYKCVAVNIVTWTLI